LQSFHEQAFELRSSRYAEVRHAQAVNQAQDRNVFHGGFTLAAFKLRNQAAVNAQQPRHIGLAEARAASENFEIYS
jgi:hypothetical protein